MTFTGERPGGEGNGEDLFVAALKYDYGMRPDFVRLLDELSGTEAYGNLVCDESLMLYAKELQEIEPFANEDEVQCMLKAMYGENNAEARVAREELILRHLGLAMHVAIRSSNPNGLQLPLLVEVANEALVWAVSTHRPDDRSTLRNHIISKAYKDLKAATTNAASVVEFSSDDATLWGQILRTQVALHNDNQAEPTFAEISERLSRRGERKPAHFVREVSTNRLFSLDPSREEKPYGWYGDGTVTRAVESLQTPDPEPPTIEDEIEVADWKKLFTYAGLSYREETAVVMYFGMPPYADDARTTYAIARSLGISVETVGNTLRTAFDKLKFAILSELDDKPHSS